MNPSALASYGPQVLRAMQGGYSAAEVLDYLIKTDKKLAEPIKKAKNAGYTPEEITAFFTQGYDTSKAAQQQGYKSFGERMNLPGMTTAEMKGVIQQQKQDFGVGGRVKGVAAAAAPIGIGLAASYALGPTAGMAANLAANYIGSKLGGGPQGPAPTPPAIGLNIPPPQPNAPSGGANAPSPQVNLANIVGTVWSVFGFKNKKLAENIANIAQQTGQDVKAIYQDMAKEYDMSTADKATKAAESKLKEITGGGPTEKLQDVVHRGSEAKKRLENATNIKEVKDELAEDMASSVIRKMHYNKKKKLLEVIFNGGARYHYYDFPKSEFNKLRKAGTAAKTSGENEYGIWWVGKNPSLGATFHEVIKPNLRQKGPYKYERKSDRPLTAEEEAEFQALQSPKVAAAKEVLGKTGKVESAALGGVGFKGKTARGMSPEQIGNRARVLNKQLDQLKSKPASERSKEMIDILEKRLSDITHYETMRGELKSKILKSEAARTSKHEGDLTLKKAMSLLPAALVKVVKEKMKTMDEQEVLKFILKHLTAKK